MGGGMTEGVPTEGMIEETTGIGGEMINIGTMIDTGTTIVIGGTTETEEGTTGMTGGMIREAMTGIGEDMTIDVGDMIGTIAGETIGAAERRGLGMVTGTREKETERRGRENMTRKI